ncbi:MAG: hypothetical protein ABSA86_07340 [Oryzomonas sp.]|jgi:hypothetical protein
MISPRALPTVMIVLSLAAADVYAQADYADWRHYGYWLCAAGLNYCVTW